jgi:hypothetical protein
MTETELLDVQKRALKELEEQKKKKDQEKAKREIKQALGETISVAEQQRVLDEIQRNKQTATCRKQGSPDQSTLDVGRKDMKRQRSLQPHIYDTIPGGTGNDSINYYRRLGNRGKSSSIAQAEGHGEAFQIETPAFHAGNHGGHGDPGARGGHANPHGYGGYTDPGGHGGHGGLGTSYPPYDSQRQPADERAQVHRDFHKPSQYQWGVPPPQQYGNYRYHSDQASAATVPPGSSSPVNVNPSLTINSRIQIPTASPTEPFKYGVIRWIGEISAVQGLVAGIEMVSSL